MTKISKNNDRYLPFNEERLKNYIDKMAKGLQLTNSFSFADYKAEAVAFLNSVDTYSAEEIPNYLIREAVSLTSDVDTAWLDLARNIYLDRLYKKASKGRNYDKELKYGNYRELLVFLENQLKFVNPILDKYSEEELKQAEEMIDPEKDNELTYSGVSYLAERYLNKYELPQERFMTISLALMQNEPKDVRMHYVGEAYWALSNLYMMTATPTLAHAGTNAKNLSSCFIDTIEDSLQEINDSNTDLANVSKWGGGIGCYLGKIRAKGSSIRGVEGASGGVLPWMKQLNNTAVSVDQLGQRRGAIAAYLDIWHKDVFIFMDGRKNNGDERKRARDLFYGLCIPDLFMEKVRDREDWYLFDPHEVRTKMGWSLEDFYDEEKGSGSFRKRYEQLVKDDSISKEKVPAITIMKEILRIQIETGALFMFYRDEANRQNANKHAGMIYSSNLCTEIMQNQSPTTVETIEKADGKVIITKTAGDFVVCNLSSTSMAKVLRDDVLERLMKIQVRMTDNVIDVNELPVAQAEMTNEKYRAIGIGDMGINHAFALNGIAWESQEAVDFIDNYTERKAYLIIRESMKLAKEKGAYPLFEGSEWSTGEYFVRKGYVTRDANGEIQQIDGKENWYWLCKDVMEHGIRNAYLMATAPTGSISIIAGTTATIDPVLEKFYFDEKKDGMVPNIAPDLDYTTEEFYKDAVQIDQNWSIKQNARRQKHVDQASSFNIYIPKWIKAKQLLELHLDIWDSGIKTSYYTQARNVPNCEWCQ